MANFNKPIEENHEVIFGARKLDTLFTSLDIKELLEIRLNLF